MNKNAIFMEAVLATEMKEIPAKDDFFCKSRPINFDINRF